MSALHGIRVLDLSQGAAGPTAGAILADHGADVIKLEPIDGEWGRTLGPPFWQDSATAAVGMNRNKRSLALDLRHPEGLAIARRLVGSADVLLESFRPGVMERLGLGYDAVAELADGIVYCSITAFGATGPRRDQPGVDGIVQALSGLMSITGSAGGEPVKVGVPAADMSAAYQAVQGILLALFARARTGSGQHVEVSLLDSLVAFQLVPLTMHLQTGEVPGRHGSGAAYTTPNEAYRTADGELMIAAYTPPRWKALCGVLDRPDLLEDERFSTNPTRMRHRQALREELERSLATEATAVWMERLSAVDVMCAPVADYAQLLADPQLAVNDMIVELTHPAGPVRTVGVPIKLSQTPGATGPGAPLIGEHSRAILLEIGMDADAIDDLFGQGVIGASAAAKQLSHEPTERPHGH